VILSSFFFFNFMSDFLGHFLIAVFTLRAVYPSTHTIKIAEKEEYQSTD